MTTSEEGKHEPHTFAQPVKPALIDEERKKKKREKKALTWDEHAIEEHDLLRGTRMKIDEPNTPYHHFGDNAHSSDNESESSYKASRNINPNSINWNHLENKLGAVAAARDLCPSSPSMSSVEGGLGNSSGPDSDVELERKRNNMKKKEFELHRKAHYNEMEAVRKWRMEHDDDDDDDDE